MKIFLLFIFFLNYFLEIYTSSTIIPLLNLKTSNSYDNFLINKYNLTKYDKKYVDIKILDNNYYKEIIIMDKMIILKTTRRKIIFFQFNKTLHIDL
jgi:hypothetical protein